MHISKKYTANNDRANNNQKVFVYLITSYEQIIDKVNNPILQALEQHELSQSIGLYFYRFKHLHHYNAFSKIGEVSRIEGIQERFKRGWHGTESYSDTYLTKNIHHDVKLITETNPMYFVFYQFDLLNSYPKIDELIAFKKHQDYFNVGTRTIERPNGNYQLGQNLAWHSLAFEEVLQLKFPDGSSYPF